MNSTSLAIGWVQLLALLAAEVGLVALGVVLVRRRCPPSAAWHRTFCQASIAAVLVITAGELSGSVRLLGGWAANTLAWRDKNGPPEGSEAVQLDRPTAPRYESQGSSRAGVSFAPDANPAAGVSRGQAGRLPFLASSRPTDAVSDSMAVLWLWLIWAAGATLAGARVCLAQCLCLVFQFRRRPVAEPALVERVEALARSLGIGRPVRVMQSKRLTSPVVFGLIRPTVGLPPNFTHRFDAAQQNAVLAHELAHLAAHDPFWCLLADAAAVLLWWHPAVWWLRRHLHLASEMAADEASLLVADGPRILAECLVEMGARLARPQPLSQLGVSGFRSHLGRRVQRLLHLEGRAWSPLPPFGAALIRIFGPMAMTAIVVLCTAWAAPQALMKGDSMKTMQLNWKRSLATLALLAAFNGPEATVAVAQLDNSPAPPAPVPEVAPATPALPALPSADAQATEVPAAPRPPVAPAAAEEAFRTRYGLRPGGALPMPARARRPPRPSEHGSKVEATLRYIILDEVSFDGLPLSEVLHSLNEQSIKRDPAKAGVNFLINPNFRPVARRAGVDPATGLPPAAAPEQYDVASVVIKFNLPLRNVTMKDLLDAIVMVADHPIGYTMEDFGVVFAAKPETLEGEPVVVAPAALPPEPFSPAPPSRPMR